MKKLILNITILTSMMFLLNACVKDKYDGPVDGCIQDTPVGTKITIEKMLSDYSGQVTEDVYIEGTVVSSDETGNIYKSLTIQEGLFGTTLQIDGYDLYSIYQPGRNIYVNLKGLFVADGQIGSDLDEYGSVSRMSLATTENAILRGKCFQPIIADTITLADLNDSYLNRLVTIVGVEFVGAANKTPYAIDANSSAVNSYVSDCINSELIVRNSTYSTFATDTMPQGNGTITGIFSVFNSDYQLFIRSTDDVVMNDARCDGESGGGGGGGGGSAGNYLYKDFDDNSLTSGGWTTYLESGTVDWELGSYNSFYYGNISNFDFNTTSNSATEAWLISPAVDLSATTDPVLNFRNAYKYNGDPLEVFVSTNYSSGDPSAATWSDLTNDATWSAGDFSWVDSEDILLTSYKEANVHIAFKYTGSDSDGSNWEVDEIEIKEL